MLSSSNPCYGQHLGWCLCAGDSWGLASWLLNNTDIQVKNTVMSEAILDLSLSLSIPHHWISLGEHTDLLWFGSE